MNSEDSTTSRDLRRTGWITVGAALVFALAAPVAAALENTLVLVLCLVSTVCFGVAGGIAVSVSRPARSHDATDEHDGEAAS